jgi:hypothetical protein
MSVQRDDKDELSQRVEGRVASQRPTSTLNRRTNSDRRTVTRSGRRSTDPHPVLRDTDDYLKSVE